MKSIATLRALSNKELTIRLEEFKKQLFKLGSKGATGAGAENPGRAKMLKRNIAKVKTLMKEKEIIQLKNQNGVGVTKVPSTSKNEKK
jgi:large subunit ribosomal protein L29